MKVIRTTRKGQKVGSEINCELLELFLDSAFMVIKNFAGSFIESHEVARADRFSDEMYGNDLRRVKNFGSSAELVGETVLPGASPKPRNFTH